MQTETQGNAPTFPISRRKRRGVYQGFALLLSCLLLIGTVALLLLRQQAHSGTQPLPATLHWQQIQPRHPVESLVAAPGDPAVLYVCTLPPFYTFAPDSLLRSNDGGVHWQTLTVPLGNTSSCLVAVNPLNANDLYISIISLTAPRPPVLKHSSDGGQTWITIRATLMLAPHTSNIAWAGGRLSFFGQRLFAVQGIQGTTHLISSSDGGHTWTILDAALAKTDHQELLSYIVDPATTTTLYELVGVVANGWFSYTPSDATPVPTPSPIPASQLTRHLYKTVDGGATWHEILSSIPYGSSLQLAPAHPNQLYVGGPTGKLSATSRNTFHMQYSTDGGNTWHTIALPADKHLRNNWFVAASGKLYITDVKPGKTQDLITSIQCYDPPSQQWSTLPVPATSGILLAVTTALSHKSDVLWFENLDLIYRGTS